MSAAVLLDNVQHQDLRFISRHAAEFGDNVNQVLISPAEYREVQREYPIFFRKDDKGRFQSVALLGLDKDENLFLDPENGWQANYVPAIQQRGGFLIGFGETENSGEARPVILVDIDHPRISQEQGEPLFKPHGGNAPALDRISRALQVLHSGREINERMFAAFESAGLLMSIELDVKVDDTTAYLLSDIYGIDGQALSRLEGDRLATLNATGFLAAAFHVLSSQGNMSRLIELKRRQRSRG